MKLADVEFLAQGQACILSQFFKLELAYFIGECLAGPHDIAIILTVTSCSVLLELVRK